MTDLIVYPDHSSHAAFAFVGCSISAIHSQKCEVNGDPPVFQAENPQGHLAGALRYPLPSVYN